MVQRELRCDIRPEVLGILESIVVLCVQTAPRLSDLSGRSTCIPPLDLHDARGRRRTTRSCHARESRDGY
jgi:hypothetical protein